MPDYVILSVDNSGSMYTIDIDPDPDNPYTTFKNALKAVYSDAQFVERDDCDSPTGCFENQAWVDEMRSQIQAIVGQ